MKKFLFLLFFTINLNAINLKNILHKITFNYFKKEEVQKPKVIVLDIDSKIDFKHIALNLYNAAKDNNVLAVLLLLNSTGGSAASFSVIHDLIIKTKEIKPVVCLICDGAYSGGYLLASPCSYIIAHTWSGIGSIGVISQIDRFSNVKINDKIKADNDVEFYKSGEFKGITNPFHAKLSNIQKDYVQEKNRFIYKEFLEKVAKNRNLKLEDYKEWAEGRDFVASQAIKLNLIDEIGTFHEAEKKIYELLTKRNDNKKLDLEFVLIENPKKEDDKKDSKVLNEHVHYLIK